MNLYALRAQLKIDEGVRKFPYVDTAGKLTISVGRNLTDVGVSDSEIELMLSNDIAAAVDSLDKVLPWWRKMTDARQNALVNLCFNMGIAGLLTFKNTLAAMERGDWPAVVAGLESSQWAKQVGPSRSDPIKRTFLTGE